MDPFEILIAGVLLIAMALLMYSGGGPGTPLRIPVRLPLR